MDQDFIKKEKILSLEFYNYKGIFTGSLKGMRYRIEKSGEKEKPCFLVHIWDEPYNYDVTSEEEMEKSEFEFSDEGKENVVRWLNDVYRQKYMKKVEEEEEEN